MESLSETIWDVVLCGTGLLQSLLALALSRSNKKILHVDPNEYYGGPDASFSLQEAEQWAEAHSSPTNKGGFKNASLVKGTEEGGGLSFSRAYTLTLSPQLIHGRSKLLSQLVSSRAFRQLEFLAVGSFFIYNSKGAGVGGDDAGPTLNRIPSTREAVFSDSDIPVKAKRSLMKFLRFVLEYDSEENIELWKERRDEQLEIFLQSEFKLDDKLCAHVVTLALAQTGKISVSHGLAAIHRHMASMGMFGPGFAALYPKWGGGSEIAQVGCRAGAVGGGVYMLGTDIKDVRHVTSAGEPPLELDLDGGVTVKARVLVRGCQDVPPEEREDLLQPSNEEIMRRLVAVVDSPLRSLFDAVVEGSPVPAVVVVAIPPGTLQTDAGAKWEHPIYAIIHSSDTGECPAGQSIIHLSTPASPEAESLLLEALAGVIRATAEGTTEPKVLCRLQYEQTSSGGGLSRNGAILTFPFPRLDLALDDASLGPVREAWDIVLQCLGDEVVVSQEYMTFEDREAADVDDDPYE